MTLRKLKLNIENLLFQRGFKLNSSAKFDELFVSINSKQEQFDKDNLVIHYPMIFNESITLDGHPILSKLTENEITKLDYKWLGYKPRAFKFDANLETAKQMDRWFLEVIYNEIQKYLVDNRFENIMIYFRHYGDDDGVGWREYLIKKSS